MTTAGFRKRLLEAEKLIDTEWLKPKPKPVYATTYPKSKPLKKTASIATTEVQVPPTPNKYHQLLARDGNNCWLCHEPLGTDATIEHLVASMHGGPNHMTNYVLVHSACNSLLGVRSVAAKVRMREERLNPTRKHP